MKYKANHGGWGKGQLHRFGALYLHQRAHDLAGPIARFRTSLLHETRSQSPDCWDMANAVKILEAAVRASSPDGTPSRRSRSEGKKFLLADPRYRLCRRNEPGLAGR